MNALLAWRAPIVGLLGMLAVVAVARCRPLAGRRNKPAHCVHAELVQDYLATIFLIMMPSGRS